ncbi:GTPase ObgE [Phycisphaera mikurensis]|uniref:GTPase Obg n=1 Tax=Phycisphaera mikurensis (strain NBRC 102666 / KCTC 22515 / FYK2301M01) TaxID=1142394 RepID=I0IDJ8_PHYMF|nr:GTPase ObgE [Phycisphaera mikurensis]MBB6441156.1 GTP-binding protein [Phycisphaera mikurensis]BAM03336.1 GTPase Obg [Phycisphaera mikurensis NBRC 102666]
MFIDSAEIIAASGKGGDGCLSFRRMKYIPKGGPDGGNGGDGGSLVLVADPDTATLLDFAGRHHWRADDGGAGRGSQQNGKKAEDLVIRLPVGTQVFHRETGALLCDLTEPGQRVVLAAGGRGGRGNEAYATPTHQVPTEFDPGGEGVELPLKLELKLVADVGLLGLPNAGKSTLLSRVSSARPRIADYPFTTLVPQPGVADLGGGRRLVVCDVPGLIEHAAEGQGLGSRFLRHIERTSLLVHLVDCLPADGSDPASNWATIRGELQKHSAALGAKPEVTVLSQVDKLAGPAAVKASVREFHAATGTDPLAISSASGTGLRELLERCWERLETKTQQRPAWGGAAGPGRV